jgi:hypothetical protein
MSMRRNVTVLCTMLCFSTLAVACGASESNSDASLPDAGIQDAGLQDAGLQAAGQRDAGQRDAGYEDTSEPSYTSIFTDPDHDSLFVAYREASGVRLFELSPSQGWSEMRLPENLRDESQLQLTSVVSTEFDVLISTEQNGAWRWPTQEARWEAFAPDWFDSSGRITHLRKVRDQVFAFHEIDPNAQDGIELWQRRQRDWEFIRDDMFMIIDYMPRDEFLLRATRYGTVESSMDAGQTWQLVPGVIGSLPPRIFEWGEDVAVATTHGVWITRDDAQSWEQLSNQGGQTAALVGDEVVVANLDGQVLGVALDDGTTRELASLPVSPHWDLQLAVSGETLIVANHGPELFRLPLEPASPDPAQWQRVDPAQ